MLISLELWAHYSTMPRKTRDEAIFLNLLGIEEHLGGYLAQDEIRVVF